MCKYCNFHSEIFLNNKISYFTLSSVACSGTLFKRTWWALISPVTNVEMSLDLAYSKYINSYLILNYLPWYTVPTTCTSNVT